MANFYGAIRRSRLKHLVQSIYFIFFIFIIFQAIDLIYAVSLVITSLLIQYFFLKKEKQLLSFAILDKNIWTFEYVQHGIDTKEVYAILDHHLYFIFLFKPKGYLYSQVIWADQLSAVDYKKMKVIARLYIVSS